MKRLLTTIALLSVLTLASAAQGGGLPGTWKFPESVNLSRVLAKPTAVIQRNPASVTFVPGLESGAVRDIAVAMAGTPEAVDSLLKTMADLRGVYDKAMADEGRSHNLASGFTYFLAANLAVYFDEEPTEKAQQEIFRQMEAAISETPELANMSDGEKQRVHDWLVGMGGLTLATYVGARASKDELAQANAKELAAVALRLVLEIEPEALTVDDRGITVDLGI